jgi:menaquinone-specific isochorismate synthase
MKVVSLPSGQTRGRQSLLSFLQQCQQRAREQKHPQLASISLEVKAMDPLAVWEAIYDPQEYHFFFEKPADQISISAAGAVLVHTASGADRFKELRRWSEEWLEHTLAIGDLDIAFNGPHFLGGFSFEEDLPENYPYAPATAFLPRWQVSRRGEQYGAVANALVDEDTDIQEVANRILAAHGKFYAFDYSNEDLVNESPVYPEHIRVQDESDAHIAYAVGVNRALEAIAAGEIQKVVLARTQDIRADQPFFPPLILDRLRKRYPTCHVFSFGAPTHIAFLGATPEKLVELSNERLYTEAIAGTIPSSESAREDALLGERLLASNKDLREHRMVVDMLMDRLSAEGLTPECAEYPSLLRLSNVQHLHTPVTASLKDSSILHWVEVLQPTPAVGGVPRDIAFRRIQQYETACRGLYAGSIGWWNSKGEGLFIVGIRSALVQAENARLWAGAGIVEGSQPEQEWKETVSKISALREVFKKPFTSSDWMTHNSHS